MPEEITPANDEPSRADELRAKLAPLIDETRELFDRWEPVLKPEGPALWFEGGEEMPPFDPSLTAFSPANAWWLSELCSIAYTPDIKEADRRWNRDKPSRYDFLNDRTPFREVLNIHKTGNHVSLYKVEESKGTVLCFRGTNKLRQWIMNLTALPVSWPLADDDGATCVHHGFQILFNRVWPLIEPSLVECEGPLVFTGHSLGAAFATLAAAVSPVTPTSLVSFGSPRVGNQVLVDRLRELPVHRIVNHHDIVTLLPQREPRFGRRDFRHVGDLHYLGKNLGDFFTQPGPEASDDPNWKPPEPIDFLKSSLGSPEPPECVLDHAPMAYSAKLRALAGFT
jgi:hypothetical protein